MVTAIQASCPGCSNRQATPVGRREALHLVRCTECTLVYSHPPPVGAVNTKYLEEYDLAEHFAGWEPRKRLLYERRLREIDRLAVSGRRLFDVGCGNGQFLQLAAAGGWNAAGIELNPPAAAAARQRGFAVIQGTLEDATDLPWSACDVVTSWDVLEHTPTPREFVRRLRRLVKPDGFVVLTTLNLASLAYHVFGLDWSMVCDDHFTYWNRRSLVRLAESEGLQPLAFRTFGVGRDFFSVLDRRRSPAEAAGSSAGAAGRWDVNHAVVMLEGVANSLFAITGGGVGLSVVLRPTSGSAA